MEAKLRRVVHVTIVERPFVVHHEFEIVTEEARKAL